MAPTLAVLGLLKLASFEICAQKLEFNRKVLEFNHRISQFRLSGICRGFPNSSVMINLAPKFVRLSRNFPLITFFAIFYSSWKFTKIAKILKTI